MKSESTAQITVSLEDLIRLQADARGFSFLPRQPVSSILSGRHNSRLRGRGLAFEELRDYHPGDDIRTIDWRATARLGSPYVRVYNEERERSLLLVVDQRIPMFFGSRRAMKSVTAVEAAALTAWRTARAGDSVGGIVFNEDSISSIRPRRGNGSVLRLLHEMSQFNQQLADTTSSEGSLTLDDALEDALQVAKHDHLVVVISDLDGAGDRTRELCIRLSGHNDVIIVAVYDPLGAQLSGHPGMKATDRGQTWEVPAGERFEKDFRASFQAVSDHWTTLFHDLKVPIFPLSTASLVSDQIKELLGHHG